MQGKGLVKFFTYFLLAVSLYQLFLFFPTNKIENNAERYAKMKSAAAPQDQQGLVYRRARQNFMDSVSKKTALNLGIVRFTYEQLKKQQIGLGLDLRGGMSVTLQVDLEEFLVALSNDNADPTFRDALAKSKEKLASTQTDFVTLFSETYREVSGGKKLAPIFAGNTTLKIEVDATDDQVTSIIRKQAKETVERTYSLLKQRIDALGVASPNVFLDVSTDRILVELPGVEDPEAAREYLQASAKLEFWEVYSAAEIIPGFVNINTALKMRVKPQGMVDTTGLYKNPTKDTTGFYRNAALLASDSTNNPLFNLFKFLNQSTNTGYGVLATVSASDTAQVMAYLNSVDGKRNLPRNARFVWSDQPTVDQKTKEFTNQYELYALRLTQNGVAKLEGDKVTRASADVDPTKGGNVISLEMDAEGARIWRDMTTANVGHPIAVVLDNKVASAPNINEPIGGGRSSISGSFTAEEATRIANLLQIGKLPARTEIVESAIVGPSLGAATISSGLTSMLAALAAIVIFMIIYYNLAGLVSIIALLANLIFMLATLASFGTVLTLPGIAGIVLTMGVAVDANVVIYERVREELRHGKALSQAIFDGFKHSYAPILDANVVQFIMACILIYFGLGPIKGFGVVLAIGVVSSVFTAVFVSQLLFDFLINRGMNISFGKMTIFKNANFDFVGMRKITYLISGTVVVLAIASFFTRGFELGVDFQGGRSYTVAIPNAGSTEDIANKLTAVFDNKKPIVKEFDKAGQVKIVTQYMQNSAEKNADDVVRAALKKGIEGIVGSEISEADFKSKYVLKENKVGATVADDIRKSALLTTIIALGLIFVYILLRFRKWQYSAGTIVALFHDVSFVLAAFSLLHGFMPFSLEIDQAFIAAILTVIGYSMNDTVIVFDRIRENLNSYEYASMSIKDTINKAINTTLSRTIVTSATVFFVCLVLFLFGGDGIKAFSFAMLIGVIVGTYSSIFIATPILVDFTKGDDLKTLKAPEVTKSETV